MKLFYFVKNTSLKIDNYIPENMLILNENQRAN